MNNDVILVFSDLHLPYQHRGMLKFLKDLKELYRPTRVICCGDELDYHAISYHEKDPNLPGPYDEFNQAKAYLQGIIEIFPTLDLIESNHGSLVYRKGKSGGLPNFVFKSYNEILDVPETWKWYNELKIVIQPTGQEVLFHHGISSRALLAAKERGCCLVQGHYHSRATLEFYGKMICPNWALQLPSLVDENSLAMAYSKNSKDRPKIGAGLIINGHPLLFMMPMDPNGKYSGLLYNKGEL